MSMSSLALPVLNEAEELRRQQLAIEREVSALKKIVITLERNKFEKLPDNNNKLLIHLCLPSQLCLNNY